MDFKILHCQWARNISCFSGAGYRRLMLLRVLLSSQLEYSYKSVIICAKQHNINQTVTTMQSAGLNLPKLLQTPSFFKLNIAIPATIFIDSMDTKSWCKRKHGQVKSCVDTRIVILGFRLHQISD